MNRYDLAASANFTSWNKLFPGPPDILKSLGECNFNKLSDTCDTVYTIIKSMSSNEISLCNLRIRLKLLCGILPIIEKQIKRYFNNTLSGFQLFKCLFRIIFKTLLLKECQKEILLHTTGYLDNRQQLSLTDMENKLNKARSGLINKQNSLSCKISSIIAKFKILLPYLDYNVRFDFSGNLIWISPSICKSIRTVESAKHVTPWFIAKVFSIIYGYEIIPENVKGRDNYFLLKPDMADKDEFTEIICFLENKIEHLSSSLSSTNLKKIIGIFSRNKAHIYS